MKIWFRDYRLEDLVKVADRYLAKLIGIELLELGDDFIRAKMPVDERTWMPMGLLHGGASCVLAESLGSYASYLSIDLQKQSIVGLEINANHLRSAREGWVFGTVRPLQVGRSIHVWDIRIEDADQSLICVSRLTVKVNDRPADSPLVQSTQ